LLEWVRENKATERLALPTIDGLIIVDTREIVYCESEDSYSKIFLEAGKPIVVAQTLKKVETLLGGSKDFLRIHHSYLINLRFVRRYIRGDGGEVSLANGTTLPVSRTKKQEFLDRLKRL
jgi:two-component system LytT family response regulator